MPCRDSKIQISFELASLGSLILTLADGRAIRDPDQENCFSFLLIPFRLFTHLVWQDGIVGVGEYVPTRGEKVIDLDRKVNAKMHSRQPGGATHWRCQCFLADCGESA